MESAIPRSRNRAKRCAFFNRSFPGETDQTPPGAYVAGQWLAMPGTELLGRARRQLRDLATLDKQARQHCSRAERCRFLLAYQQRPRLDHTVRATLRGSLEYRRQRWPDEWPSPSIRPLREERAPHVVATAS